MNLVLAKLPFNRAILYLKQGDSLTRVYPLIEASAEVSDVVDLIEKIKKECAVCVQTQNATA